MKKTFMGVKLRRLRAERGLSQIGLAQALGLSPSYLNQLEQNQRPFTVSVLLKLNRALGVDIQEFSEDEEARLMAGVQEALAEAPEPISLPEFQELASQMPAVARAVIDMRRRQHELQGRLEALSLQLGDNRSLNEPVVHQPFELVRDFFFNHQNHFDGLDRAAERLAAEADSGDDPIARLAWLTQRLAGHGILVRHDPGPQGSKRRFDARHSTLTLAGRLDPAQKAFQMATQLALTEFPAELDALTQVAPFTRHEPARQLARLGLANYFAGALLLPYGRF